MGFGCLGSSTQDEEVPTSETTQSFSQEPDIHENNTGPNLVCQSLHYSYSAAVQHVWYVRGHSCTSAWGSSASPSPSLTGPTAICFNASMFLFQTVTAAVKSQRELQSSDLCVRALRGQERDVS